MNVEDEELFRELIEDFIKQFENRELAIKLLKEMYLLSKKVRKANPDMRYLPAAKIYRYILCKEIEDLLEKNEFGINVADMVKKEERYASKSFIYNIYSSHLSSRTAIKKTIKKAFFNKR